MSQPIGYSYVRFSSKKQGKGSSYHRQTQDTIAGESPESWCARQRPPVLFDTSLTFQDLGKSAYSGHKQEELYAFLQMVETGRIRPGSFLLVEKIDRISRKGVDEGYELCKKILKAGVSIVSLSRGRVYGPEAVKGLMQGALELQMELEHAYQYSKNLSDRVSAAKELARQKAREKKRLATATMPPWLTAVGEGDGRRAIVVAEKVATAQRIFDLAIAGMGLTRIIRTLIEDGTPPLTRQGTWSRSSVRRLLTDRTALGEYQPMRRVDGKRVKDGSPIEGYYPQIVSEGTFGRAAACIGSRKLANAGRDSKLFNPFSGLLKDACTGKSYITNLSMKGEWKQHVLRSGDKLAKANSFPFAIFEAAFLALLREVDPMELLPPTNQPDEVLTLSGELRSVEAEIKAITADLEREFSPALAGILRKKEARHKEIEAKLAEARLRAANPLCESWGGTKSLLAVLEDASGPGDPDAARLRLRAALRRVIESIWVLVEPRGRDRHALVHVYFHGDTARTYVIDYRPPWANKSGAKPGHWVALTVATEDAPGRVPLDMSKYHTDPEVRARIDHCLAEQIAASRETFEFVESVTLARSLVGVEVPRLEYMGRQICAGTVPAKEKP
jgi:DNA invertase Pin-like site-specific DNA recombinase